MKVKRSERWEDAQTIMRWQSFMPRTKLRVLLVEADDSTRHIIAALLRKCGYTVVSVADGLSAWETLKEKAHCIDLVLTEVELPSLTGIHLLTMMKEQEACRHIPVTMMSSMHFTSLVFKCMLRGAVDFLIKPIRMNELRNLWQHVWRKQSHFGGFAEGRSDAVSENSAASNQPSDNEVSAKKMRTCNEKIRETKGFCTMPGTDIWSSHMHPKEDYAHLLQDGEDIQKYEDMKLNNTMHVSNTDEAMLTTELEACNRVSGSTEKSAGDTVPTIDAGIECNEKVSRCAEISNLTRVEDCQPCGNHMHVDSLQGIEGSNNPDNSRASSSLKGIRCMLDSSPFLELSLTRSIASGCGDHDPGNHTLNHSDVSAFSPYSSKIAQSHIKPLPSCPSHQLNPGQGSTAIRNAHGADFIPVRDMTYDCLFTYGTFLPPEFCNDSGRLLQCDTFHNQPGVHDSSPCQSNHVTSNFQQNQQLHGQDPNLLIDGLVTRQDDIECSENHPNTPPACAHMGLCYESKLLCHDSDADGSNRNISASSAVTERLTHTDISINGIACRKLSEREAALTKFRLKRQGRCFEKKVRYQSRKLLAEKRPRLKGQFVRHMPSAPSGMSYPSS